MGFYVRVMTTPGTPVVNITEAAYRAMLARYVKDVDSMEAALVADTNWITFPDIHLWQSVPGTFNPTVSQVSPPAAAKATHRRGDTIY